MSRVHTRGKGHRGLALAVVAAAMGGLSCSAGRANALTGLVAQWGMEEGTGNVSTADTAGSGSVSDTAPFYPGTLVNPAQSPHWVPGKVGQYALDLTANDNVTQPLPYLKVNSSADLQGLSAYTVSGWFRFSTVPLVANRTNPGLVNTRSGNPGNYFDIQIKGAADASATTAPGLHADIGYGGGLADHGGGCELQLRSGHLVHDDVCGFRGRSTDFRQRGIGKHRDMGDEQEWRGCVADGIGQRPVPGAGGRAGG